MTKKATTTNDTKAATTNTEATIMETVDYTKFTTKELNLVVEERNNERSTPIDVTAKAKKTKLVEALLEDDFFNEVDTTTPFAATTKEVRKVKLASLQTCPLNPRHDIDYLSTELQDAIYRAGGETKLMTVVPAEVLGGKKGKYFVLAGNRTRANLEAVVVERLGVNAKDYDVDVLVREYEGTKRQIEAQVLTELEGDNDQALSFSPIDKLNIINMKLASGRTKSSIAREKGYAPSYVSEITRLNFLPENVLELIHFGSRLDYLANKTAEELTAAGVPFIEENGEVIAQGISYKNGLVLASLYPKAPARSKFKEAAAYNEAVTAHAEACEAVTQTVVAQEVIEAALTMSEGSLKKFVRGGTPEPTTEPTTEATTEVKASGESTEPVTAGKKDKTKVVENAAGTYSGKGSDNDLVRMLMDEPSLFADSLTAGIGFVEGWEERCADLVRVGDPQITRALKTLLIEGVLDFFEFEE